jgi:membrane protein DedA with SNARE-associated domain/membrane-associated phospholipid phosphatase
VKIGPLLIAALVAVFVVLRWRRSGTEQKVLAIGLVIVLAVYGSGLVELPNFEHLIEDLGKALGRWTYALVGLMAFLETGAFIGLVAPGEFTVIFGGVVAGQGVINVGVLIAIVWIAAVSGDSASFWLGRKLGRGFLERHGPRVKITEERLQTVERFFQQHGGATILIGRFVGLARALAPFVAGASKMSYRRFLPFDIVGAGIWGSFFVVLGYLFWRSFDRVVEIARQGTFALGTFITVVVGAIALYRYWRVPENRATTRRWLDERRDRPFIGPLVRVIIAAYERAVRPAGLRLAGPIRFVWGRVTPGQLGLELTTLLAVGGVGGFSFVLLATHVDRGDDIALDRRGLDAADDLRSSLVVDIAEAVSALGSLPVVSVLVLTTVVVLAARRRMTEALPLAVAFVLVYAGVHITKAAVDRPRPLDPLADFSGSAFPSGHAAYSVAFIAVAVALRHAIPRLAGQAAVIVVALVLAAAVGVSRAYLRAHNLSDVFAGWALGAALFAGCGVVALLVAAIRQNPRDP